MFGIGVADKVQDYITDGDQHGLLAELQSLWSEMTGLLQVMF